MTATVTTVTFKRIKEFVLALKEETGRNNVLVHPDELRAQLEATDEEWQFSDAEMMTAVGHLANHGYVTILRGSKGEESNLLAPDLLGAIAVAAYSYMSLIPIIQPPIMRLLTTRKERLIRMEYAPRPVSRLTLVVFIRESTGKHISN